MALSIPVAEIVEKSSNPILGIHESWERVLLKDIADILNGFAFKSFYFDKEEGIPLLRIRDVGNNKTETRYKGPYDEKYLVEYGDLVIGMDGDFNCARWKGPKALLNQRVCKVTVKSPHYSMKFLEFVLPGYLKAINEHTSSVTVKHLSSKSVDDIPLPLPPTFEQKRIISKIEELFTRLDAGNHNLVRVKINLARYKASVLKAACEGRLVPTEAELARAEGRDYESGEELLQRILAERKKKWEKEQRVKGKDPRKIKYKEPEPPDTEDLPELPEGWVWVKIEQLLDTARVGMKTGPFGTLLKKSDHRKEGIPIIGIENIGAMKFVPGSKIHISEKKAGQLAKYDVKADDVIISRSGTVGEVAIIPEGLGDARLSTNVMRVTLAPFGMLPKFFALLFNGHPLVLDQVSDLCKGSTRNFLNQRILKSIVFPLPPLKEQKRIIIEIERKLSIIKEVQTTIEVILKRTSRLRQAVLKRAFEGNLVPQDPQDEPADVLLERNSRREVA